MNALYFVEIQGLKIRGKWFLECDRDETRADVLETIRLYGSKVLKVLEVVEDEGTCRDVTADMIAEAGLPDDYRTPFTGEDKTAWENDRRRALEMVS